MTYTQYLNSDDAYSQLAQQVLGDFIGRAEVIRKKYFARDYILRAGEFVSGIWLLVSGRVLTVSNRSDFGIYAFHEFSAPEFFCEYEVLMGRDTILTDISAKTDCEFLILKTEDYMRWITADTSRLLARFREILNSLLVQGADERKLMFLSSETRLMSFLTRYYESRKPENGTVIVTENREEIAELLGISTRSTNRAIKFTKDSGIIKIIKGKINISKESYELMIRKINTKK